MASKRFLQDDFVLTISDDETELPHYEESDDLDAPEDNGLLSADLKRKRDDHKEPLAEKAKKRKKQKRELVHNTNKTSVVRGEDDGAINPDFEFSIGRTEESLENGFDDWDIPTSVDSKKARTALGIDEIIARRRAAKKASQTNGDTIVSAEEDEDENGAVDALDADEDEGEDELLAEDGFGMGAVSDEDEEGHSEDDALEQEDNERSSSQDGERPQSGDEDEDGVAVPVPHPDDIMSEVSAEDAEEDPRMAERRAAFFAPEEPLTESNALSTTSKSFQSMSLSRPILKGLSAVGFTSPTPIQIKTVPVALMGKDVVGGAVTGSGKTAAFVIPILERLLYRPKQVATTRVAILMPTRELAVQCYSVATKLASYTDITCALIVGGLSLREQEQTLKKRPDVVIATPGRFIDHMRNSASFAVESLEILVLDEADRMLEDGFADELNEILSTIPKSRQTMLFSATMTEDVDKLIRAGLNRPVRLMVDSKRQTVQQLTQEFIKLKGGKGDDDEERRLASLVKLCSETYSSKVIIFFPRKSLAHRVKVLFSLHGIKAAELHGSMSQEQRLAAISSFRDGQCTHLLATDLASRGLDIPRVETVINFTVPTTTTTYLHRVGRTARAGRTGVSCTLFSAAKTGPSTSKSNRASSAASERSLLRPILRLARSQNADIRTRTLPPAAIDDLVAQVKSMQSEIDAILSEEKEERLLQQTERDITKGENLVRYEEEIASRPKRTWFQGEKDKRAASKLGRDETLGITNGEVGAKAKKEKRKLSGKEKKRLLDKDERLERGVQGWKKGKEERAGKGVLAARTAGKKTTSRTGKARPNHSHKKTFKGNGRQKGKR